MDKKAVINALRNTAQSASNTIAEGVSSPVDLIASGLRKVGLPIPSNAVGGSEWMAQQGLTQPVPEGIAKTVGETAGLVVPAVGFSKPAQIAAALRQGGENLMAPSRLNKQAGVVGYHGTMTPGFDKFTLDTFGKTDSGWLGKGIYAADSPVDASAYASVNNKPGGAVYRVDMDLKNPLEIVWEAENRGALLAKRRELGSEGFTEWLKSQGHDGVKFVGPKGALNSAGERDIQYMAIDPDAVKQIPFGRP